MPSGYSYIQILVVLAIIVILAGVASPYYVQWQNRARLQSAADTLLADTWLTQTKAIQREHDAAWGLHINDASKQYVLFHGSTYSSSDVNNITVQYPSTVTISPSQDIAFNPVTGAVTSGSDVTFSLTSSSLPLESRSITIHAQGAIAYN